MYSSMIMPQLVVLAKSKDAGFWGVLSLEKSRYVELPQNNRLVVSSSMVTLLQHCVAEDGQRKEPNGSSVSSEVTEMEL